GDGFGLSLAVTALLDPAAAAGGLARAIAGAAENAGKDIGFPVDEVRIAVAPGGDQADVFGNRGMGGARPLAIDDLVEIVGIGDIRRLQNALLLWRRPVFIFVSAALSQEARFTPGPIRFAAHPTPARPRKKGLRWKGFS